MKRQLIFAVKTKRISRQIRAIRVYGVYPSAAFVSASVFFFCNNNYILLEVKISCVRGILFSK
jgi:hypothetical protein